MTVYLSPSETPAGFGPFQQPTPIGSRIVPTALQWDGATRQWVLSGDQFASVHPVDQAMMIGCCFRRGSVPSAPDVGNTVFEIRSLGSSNVRDDAESRIRSANPVARLLAEGKVAIKSVDAEVSQWGRLLVAVTYHNLVTDVRRRNPIKLTVP